MNLSKNLRSFKDFGRSPEVLKQTQKKLKSEKGNISPDDVLGLSSKNNEEFNNKRIEIYLDRLVEFFRQPNLNSEEEVYKYKRKIEKYKAILFNKFIIKEDQIPDAVYILEQRIAAERGHGYIPITDEFIARKNEEIISTQEKTLADWVDYLTGPDSYNSPWFKYLALRSVLTMGELDKNKWEYAKRSNKTVKPFADLNSEILGVVERILEGQTEFDEIKAFTDEEKESLEKIIESGSFKKLYALAQKKYNEADQDMLQVESGGERNGIWRKFNQTINGTSQYKELNNSLKGYNTGWCTASSEETAKDQLAGGDFYVYYRANRNGEFVVPKVAIRMEGGNIAEIRGTGPSQELDGDYSDLIKEQASELGGYEVYEKKSNDMKLLTKLLQKNEQNLDFSVEEIKFLYECDDTIQGFGRQKDPRIAELISKRRISKDFATIFGVEEDQLITDLDMLTAESNHFFSEYAGDYLEAAKRPNENEDFFMNLFVAFNSNQVKTIIRHRDGIKAQLYHELFHNGRLNSSNLAKIIEKDQLPSWNNIVYYISSPNIKQEQIEELVSKLNNDSLLSLCMSEHLSDSALVSLAQIKRDSKNNLKAILSNPGLSSESILQLVMANPDYVSPQSLFIDSLLSNNNTPSEVILLIKDVFESDNQVSRFSQIKDTTKIKLLNHPNYPIDDFVSTYDDYNSEKKFKLFQNPKVPLQIIKNLSERSDFELSKNKILETLATSNSNPQVLLWVLTKLDSVDQDCRNGIFFNMAHNQYSTPDVLKELIKQSKLYFPKDFEEYPIDELEEEVEYDFDMEMEWDYTEDSGSDEVKYEMNSILKELWERVDKDDFVDLANTFFYNNDFMLGLVTIQSLSQERISILMDLTRSKAPEIFDTDGQSVIEYSKLNELYKLAQLKNIKPADFEVLYGLMDERRKRHLDKFRVKKNKPLGNG
ncbi:MAG: hypothetical protein ACRCXZ_09985 [Patescibacteria group bacterium]